MPAAVVAAVLGAACAGDGPGSVTGTNQVLAAVQETVGFRVGQTGSVPFVLTSNGVPVPNQKVTFALLDAPTGVMLTDNETITDVDGIAIASIQANVEAMFTVQATSGAATAEARVGVGTLGDVQVAPFFAPSSHAASETTNIDVLLLDGMRCKDVPLENPTNGQHIVGREFPLSPSGGTVEFQDVATDAMSAILARALDRNSAPVAAGCVDLPGSALLPEGLVQVSLALYDTVPDPTGTFTVTSSLEFSTVAAAGAIAAAWRDLSDCPLDPAQLWLDCTIDALSPATPDDPLDCVPSGVPGGEGPVGDALLARRGTLIVGPVGTTAGCRDVRDVAGAISVDALTMGLYGSPLPQPIVALPAIAADAAHILDVVTLISNLDVSAGDRPDRFFITHTLETANFSGYNLTMDPNAIIPHDAVTLESLGLPVLDAQTTATTADGQIFIAEHGFTFRLGTAAREAFGWIALDSRKLPRNLAGFPAFLASLAQTDDGNTDCAALDETLCPLAGAPNGCLLSACTDGLAALGAQLAASFDPADGPGIDLHLAGSALLIDATGTGMTHELGDSGDRSKVAHWSVDLRTRLGRSTFDASFNALRN